MSSDYLQPTPTRPQVSVSPDSRQVFGLIACTVVLGIVLRATQYLANSSLWLDELMITRNLLDRSARSLATSPLAFDQVAPAGFLLTVKAVTALLGQSEYALRLYSFAAGCASIFLSAAIAARLVSRRAVVVVVLMLATSGPLIFQAAQVKPYAGDVAVGLGVLLLTLRWIELPNRARMACLAIAGVLAPWFSFPSVFFVAGCGCIVSYRVRRLGLPGLLIPALWTLSAVLAILHSRHLMGAQVLNVMHSFWAEAFPTFPPRTLAEALWPVSAVQAVLWSELGFRGVKVIFLLVMAGVLFAWRRSRTRALLVTFPVLFGFGAAYAHAYPLGERLAHWLVPLLALFLASAVEGLLRLARQDEKSPTAWVVRGLVVLAPVFVLLNEPPVFRIEEVKPVLRDMGLELREGDALYVHYEAGFAFSYYGPRLAISPTATRIGRCTFGDPRAYLADVDMLRDHRRIWLLFSHTVPADRDLMLSYMDSLGTQNRWLTSPSGMATTAGVDAYLYELNDEGPSKWTAETFPIAPGVRVLDKCGS